MLPMSRGHQLAFAIVATFSIVVAVYLGGVLYIWSLHNVDLFPDDLINATYAFYRLPAAATHQLLPGGVVGGAPKWIWITVLFIGVLIQNMLLWMLAAMLLNKGRKLGT